MKKLPLIFLFVAAPLQGMGWREHRMASEKLEEALAYHLYTPAPRYASEPLTGFPVLYWIHGLGGSGRSATALVERIDRAIRDGRLQPFLLVSPTDPTGRSMWTDSKDRATPMESVVVKELVPHIDTTYRTRAEKRGRSRAFPWAATAPPSSGSDIRSYSVASRSLLERSTRRRASTTSAEASSTPCIEATWIMRKRTRHGRC